MKPLRKVIIFIDWFIPGYKAGGPVQSCANLVAHLQNEFEFYIVTRDRDYCEPEQYTTIEANAWTKLDRNIHVYYFSPDKLKFSNIVKVIRHVGADTAFINGVYSLYFSILPLLILKRQKHQNIIVSARGMLAKSAINVKGHKKKLFLKVGHLLGLYSGIRFHATTENEKTDIQKAINSSIPVIIAPNLPKKSNGSSNFRRKKQKGEIRLVNVARISPEKNTKYAFEILEKCGSCGKIIFDVYGPIYNSEYWEECKKVMMRLPKNVVVNYLGSLDSARVPDTLMGYHALFMPTRGENFGHIILESFSSGCPVIISDQTPWRGLADLHIGYDLSLMHIDNFVASIHALCEQEQVEFDAWSDKAFNYGQDFINDRSSTSLNHLMLQ